MAENLQNLYMRGWWDTNQHIATILKADEFLSKLVFRLLGSDDLTNSTTEIVTAAVTIFCNARYLAHGLAARSADYIASLVIGELMAPVLPTRLVLPMTQARVEFELVMRYLAQNATVYTRGRTIDVWIAEINEANAALDEEQQAQVPDPTNMSMADYVEYLIWLAIRLPASQYMSPVALVVTSYVGVAKRGTLSDRYIGKVVDGIRDDLGITISMEPDVVKMAYTNFGRYVNANNAQNVFERWLAAIPEHALRLRLCLEQVSGSGLTAFIVVGKAYRKYNDFPWDKLNVVTDGEMDRYLIAVRTVNGNPYYGFNRDLGAAKSTLYSSIAFVAKELLIKIAGEVSLTKYQGWIKKPKNPAAVDQMINTYIGIATERMTEAIVGPSDPNLITQYDQVVNDAMNDGLFA